MASDGLFPRNLAYALVLHIRLLCVSYMGLQALSYHLASACAGRVVGRYPASFCTRLLHVVESLLCALHDWDFASLSFSKDSEQPVECVAGGDVTYGEQMLIQTSVISIAVYATALVATSESKATHQDIRCLQSCIRVRLVS